jgi:hypothetical protein
MLLSIHFSINVSLSVIRVMQRFAAYEVLADSSARQQYDGQDDVHEGSFTSSGLVQVLNHFVVFAFDSCCI